MEIKKKKRKKTLIEKKQTSIINFVIFTFMISFVFILLGFNWGYSIDVNTENLQSKAKKLENENKVLTEGIFDLNKIFLEADSILERYPAIFQDALSELKFAISEQNELAINDWEIKYGKRIKKFSLKLQEIETSRLIKDDRLEAIHNKGFYWISKLLSAKSGELNARKLMGQLQIGQNTTIDFEERIQELKAENDKKDLKNTLLEAQLRQNGSQATTHIVAKEKDVSNCTLELEKLQKEFERYKAKELKRKQKIKERIKEEIEIIDREIVGQMEGQNWFKIRSSKEEVAKLRSKLELRISNIKNQSDLLDF